MRWTEGNKRVSRICGGTRVKGRKTVPVFMLQCLVASETKRRGVSGLKVVDLQYTKVVAEWRPL